MQTEVYVRHSPECPHRDNRYYRRCRCCKWIAFIGIDKRISTQTRSWEEAERKAQKLAAESSRGSGQTVAEAVRLFIEDKQQQGGSKIWIDKFRRELTPLVAFCTEQAVTLISDTTLHHLEEFRKTWTGKAVHAASGKPGCGCSSSTTESTNGMSRMWLAVSAASRLSRQRLSLLPANNSPRH